MRNSFKNLLLFIVCFGGFHIGRGQSDELTLELEFKTLKDGQSFKIYKSYILLENEGRCISELLTYADNYSERAVDTSIERVSNLGESTARRLYDSILYFYDKNPELVIKEEDRRIAGSTDAGRFNVSLFTGDAALIISKEYPMSSQEEVDFWNSIENELGNYSNEGKLVEEFRWTKSIANNFYDKGRVNIQEIQGSDQKKYDRQVLFVTGRVYVDNWGNLWLVNDDEDLEWFTYQNQVLITDTTSSKSNVPLAEYDGQLVVIEGILRWHADSERFTIDGVESVRLPGD